MLVDDSERDPMHGFQLGNENPNEVHRLADDATREQEQDDTPKKSQPPVEDKPRYKWINKFQIPADKYNQFVRSANADGEDLDKFVLMMACKGLELWEADAAIIKNSSYYERMRGEILYEAYQDAYALAVMYSRYPNEDIKHRLMSICHKHGISPEDLTEKANRDTFAEVVEEYNRDDFSKTAQAVRFVVSMFANGRERILAKEANRLGNELGFNRELLSTARKRCQVESRRAEDGLHYWFAPSGAVKVLMSR